MPRSTSAGRMPAPHPTLPGAEQPQVSSVHKSSGKLGLLNSFFFFFFSCCCFSFIFKVNWTKKSDCCEQEPHKLVTWGHRCPWRLQAPAPPEAGGELGTIPRGRTTGSPALSDLFLDHQGLPAQLPAEQPGASLVPCHGCSWEGDKGQCGGAGKMC